VREWHAREWAQALHNGEMASCRFLSGQVEMGKITCPKKGCGSTCGTKKLLFISTFEFAIGPFFFSPRLIFCAKIWETSSHGGEAWGCFDLTVVFLHGRCSAPCIFMSRRNGSSLAFLFASNIDLWIFGRCSSLSYSILMFGGFVHISDDLLFGSRLLTVMTRWLHSPI
jgi:hypothetical protein